ncbi:MAG: hypothetical protein CMP16_01255 [Rickettsiales bacterium]|nr:hypothetical protein [Rickettsiales bacterium]|tara:strand:- start:8443 stop:8649 length:207 start_codon:yes stop_codon:yes gene_type:complete
MNEDHLNLEIRKFLKKVGISSQRVLENHIKESIISGDLKLGQIIELEMKLKVKDPVKEHIIVEKLKIE